MNKKAQICSKTIGWTLGWKKYLFKKVLRFGWEYFKNLGNFLLTPETLTLTALCILKKRAWYYMGQIPKSNMFWESAKIFIIFKYSYSILRTFWKNNVFIQGSPFGFWPYLSLFSHKNPNCEKFWPDWAFGYVGPLNRWNQLESHAAKPLFPSVIVVQKHSNVEWIDF